MPFCNMGVYQNKGDEDAVNSDHGIRIFYRTYGGGPVKVLMIIGFAGTHESWGPQIKGLAGTVAPNEDKSPAAYIGDGAGVEVCTFDNRGMGHSSIPTQKSEYTTKNMAKDAIALMDHLGWKRAHVFGHSMGAMISCKLASMVPQRVLSLALLNVTGGGYECIPKIDRQSLSIAIRFLRATTPEQRAAVDLDTHYSREYLEECIDNKTRRSILYHVRKYQGLTDEYVKGIRSSGMQTNYGFEGQINACWNHKMTRTELESIRAAVFPVLVIHGRNDIIAQLRHAKALAEKLYPSARMVELKGGHQITNERPEEVNNALLELIKASQDITSLYEWTNLSNKSSGSRASVITLWRSTSSLFLVGSIDRLRAFVVYFFSLFALAFGHIRRGIKTLKPVRVGPALT